VIGLLVLIDAYKTLKSTVVVMMRDCQEDEIHSHQRFPHDETDEKRKGTNETRPDQSLSQMK
jgi:hypothetical protein